MDPSNDYVEIWHAADGWRWHRKDAANHQIVSESGEAYSEHRDALEAATSLNPDAQAIVDVDRSTATGPLASP